ncbi:MAG: hypothetical protein V2A78_05590 [bacterium]
MSVKARFRLGITFLVIGSILPLGAVPVAQSHLPVAVKTAVAGILFFGFEIMAIPAVAVMGKENFELIMARVKAWMGILKPSGRVGPLRYNIGLVMFLLPMVPSYIMAYMPQWLPDDSPARLWVSLASDAMFLTSLFVLGGDFWDKLRALFVREARAVFPEKPG